MMRWRILLLIYWTNPVNTMRFRIIFSVLFFVWEELHRNNLMIIAYLPRPEQPPEY